MQVKREAKIRGGIITILFDTTAGVIAIVGRQLEVSWGSEKLDTVNDFIANYPLYRRFDLGEVYSGNDFVFPTQVLNTPKIFRWCASQSCKMERPFEHLEDASNEIESFHKEPGRGDLGDPQYALGVYSLLFACAGCASEFRCWIEVASGWYEGDKRIRKVGQVPAYDISLSPEIRDALGEDEILFKRARVCMSQSFGVGACTYLRRTLENQIQPLLESALESRELAGADEEELEGFRKIMNGRAAEDKIRLANTVLPDSVQVAGENPLELIYDRLSTGLHRQDEQECVNIADETFKVLEHIFTSLSIERSQRQAKKAYAEKIHGLRQRDSTAG